MSTLTNLAVANNINGVYTKEFNMLNTSGSSTKNNPLYVDNTILPKELDLKPSEITDMTDSEWKIWALECRNYFIQQYKEYKKPFIGNTKSLEQIIADFKKLDELDTNNPEKKVCITNNNEDTVLVGYNRYSAGITNWFPEIIEVKRTVGNRIENSIWDSVLDEKLFLKKFDGITRKDIDKRKEPKTITDGLTNLLRLRLGHPATNFRAEVSKWIWFNHLKEFANDKTKELVVYDPSGGWGGRLVGFMAMASNPIFKAKELVYIVTDPNPIVGERYKMLLGFWKQHINPNLNVRLEYHQIGSEMIHTTNSFKRYKNKVAVVFTSPPYFSRERYTEHEAQAFNKFDTYESWRDYFLEPTLDNGYELLRDGGHILWNIADVDGYTLEHDSCNILEMLEMKQKQTLKMVMGMKDVETHLGVEVNNGKYKKFENVFVFQKQEQVACNINNTNYEALRIAS